MDGRDWDPGDVLVSIGVSAAVADMPLTEWIECGPGPRNATRPESPRSKSTGEALPRTVIPLAYRNDRESRALIAAGRIPPPWPDVPWNFDLWPAKSCEVFGPRAFDRGVTDPARVDRLTTAILSASRLDPELGDAAPTVVRRLAAEARWPELDTIVGLAAEAGLAEVAPVLCEIIESDARPPRLEIIVDALGQLRYEEAALVLRSLVGQFLFAYGDLPGVRRCLRALAAIGKPQAQATLTLISWEDWPEPVAQWAAEQAHRVRDGAP